MHKRIIKSRTFFTIFIKGVRKTKALRIEEAGAAKYIDVSAPIPGPGEILLKVNYIGLCGSDLSTYRGTSPMVRYPIIPGHEISATVVDIDRAVPDGFCSKGDKATVKPYFNCGNCLACHRNRPNACEHNETLGVQRNGALCEYISVPYQHVVVCNDMDPLLIALIEPLSVGFHLNNRCKVNRGESVAVFGCGAIGLGAIAAARFKGAHVVGLDIADVKLSLAKEMGADDVVNSLKDDPVKAVKDMTGYGGADVTIECAGTPITFQQALDAVCFTGRMGIVSYSTKNVTFNTKPIVSKELEIYGSRNASGEFESVRHMILKHEIPVEKMITEVCTWNQAAAVFERWNRDPGLFTKMIVEVP